MEQMLLQSELLQGLPGAAAGSCTAKVNGESKEGSVLPAEAP